MQKFLLLFPLAIAAALPAADPSATQKADPEIDDALTRTLAAIRAKKEPIELSDFAARNVDPESNAALLYKNAWGNLELKKQELEEISEFPTLPLSDSRRAIYDEVIKTCENSLSLLTRAVALEEKGGKAGVDWEFRLGADTGEIIKQPWGRMRLLANVARAAAVRAHENKDDRAALARVREMFALARAIRTMPTLIASLVATAIDNTAAVTLQEIIPDLEVGDGSEKNKNAATLTQVKALIAFLTDDAQLHAEHQRLILAERAFAYANSKIALRTEYSIPDPNVTTRDLQSAMLKIPTDYLGATTWPESHKVMLDFLKSWNKSKDDLLAALRELAAKDPLAAADAIMRANILPNMDQSEKLYYRSVADRRMAGLALALRVYAAANENGKKLPEKLEALIDARLLARLPSDPFAPKPQNFGYLPTASQPRLYSLGENSVDDRGSLQMPNSTDAFNRWTAADLPFFLTRPTKRAETKPATKPASRSGTEL
jgi:hypothetical protein